MIPSIAFLAVSLFKPELEGPALANHLSLIENDDRFTAIILGLGDTLHAHNLPDYVDFKTRREASRKLGDIWMSREAETLVDRSKPFRVLRHDVQLGIDGYSEIRQGLSHLFAGDPFLNALSDDTAVFVSRRIAAADVRSAVACRRYILEELAADIALARQRPFTQIYPGKMLESYRVMLREVRRVPKPLHGLEECAFMRTRVRRGTVRFAGPVSVGRENSSGVWRPAFAAGL